MPTAATQNLTVRYGRRTAVEDLTFALPDGCVGLLGPNGAGKTTLINTLLGFVRPAAGRGTVLGLDAATQALAIRRRIGLMPERECHIPGMNAVSFVAYAGELSGMPPAQALRRAHEVLEYCGLGEARYRDVETYSTGMKQRIKLAQALVHGPQLVFLDEPTNGLDPAGRDHMLELIRSISHGKGVHVVVSSHILPDIERVCDSVVVLMRGRVVMEGPVEELRGGGGGEVDVELRVPSEAFPEAARRLGAEVRQCAGSRCRLLLPAGTEDPGAFIFSAARASYAEVRGFRSARRTLEEIFLEAVE